MSRVTPPVTKLTQAVRRISSTANAGRPSGLVDSQSRNAYLPRSKLDVKPESSKRELKGHRSKAELVERFAASDLIHSHGYHTVGAGHRPTVSHRTIPMMQGFRSSAPKQLRGDTSTIESFIFPPAPAPAPENPFYKLRVPLLPDNYNPNRSANSSHGPEHLDGEMHKSEISVIAAHPDTVTPVAMSEVVGNDGLEVDISQLTSGFSGNPTPDPKEIGALRELWSGLVDDFLGAAKKEPKMAI